MPTGRELLDDLLLVQKHLLSASVQDDVEALADWTAIFLELRRKLVIELEGNDAG